MSKTFSVSLILIVLMLVACNQLGKSSYNYAEIEARFLELQRAINSEDYEAWLDCYTDTDESVEAWQEFQQLIGSINDYDIVDVSNIEIDGSTASCEVKINVGTANGLETKTLLEYLEQTTGGWKIVRKASENE